ncbi:MAG: tRNA 2-thiouridine(34) synthase MnmA [Bacteroidota bacterium]
MSKRGRILVAMSGGIDSSIAAMMLHREGYEVIGMTMKTWDYSSSGGAKKETGCCSLDSINDARTLAVKYGFPHYIINISEEFESFIIDNFVDEYMSGRTPNPCVLCNTHIKWDALLKRADQLDCEFIATGHYAQVREENDRYIVSKGVDEQKDQSYFLWGISQRNLARTKFPLGTYLKNEIRQIAIDAGLADLADKNESFEICFIPDNDYRSFLKRKLNGKKVKIEDGAFVSTDGKPLGKHKGYPFYTVGQRKGLDISIGVPLYVTEIHAGTNTVVLGEKQYLHKQEMLVKDYNLIKYESLSSDFQALTKIRYRDPGTMSTINIEDDMIKVVFHRKVSAIAPGQSAVFYENDDLVGGGVIQ